jgi:hypothetical protein
LPPELEEPGPEEPEPDEDEPVGAPELEASDPEELPPDEPPPELALLEPLEPLPPLVAPASRAPASRTPASGASRGVNFHQLKLNRSPLPPVNLRNRSCTPVAPLTVQDSVVQVCAPPVLATAHVPISVPIKLSR